MPYSPFTPKVTNTPQPAIAANKKVTAADWNALVALIDANYTEFLALKLIVDGLDLTFPTTRFDTDINITVKGRYVFFGATPRTVTISDNIVGSVEIRTIATADLTLTANLAAGHLGVIYEGSPVTFLLWDSTLNKYLY